MALGSRDPLGFLIQLYQFQRLKNTLRFNAKSDLTGFKTASFVPDYHGLTWRKHGLPFWKMTWPSNTVGWNNQLLRQPELASHTFHRPWVLRVVLRPCESGTRRGGGPSNLCLLCPPGGSGWALKFGHHFHRPYNTVLKVCHQQPQSRNICCFESKSNLKRDELQCHIQSWSVSRQNRA